MILTHFLQAWMPWCPDTRSLECALQHDENAFIAQLDALEPDARRNLFASEWACERLVRAVVRHDRTDAAAVLYREIERAGTATRLPAHAQSLPEIARDAWSKHRPMLALRHVALGGASVRQYQRRFPDAREAWNRLVHEKLLTPDAYLERFAGEPELLLQWVLCGTLDVPRLWSGLANDPQTCAELLARGLNKDALFAQLDARGGAVDRAQALLKAGVTPPPLWVQRHPQVEEAIWTSARLGTLSVDRLLEAIPRPSRQALHELARHTEVTPRQRFRAGLWNEGELEAVLDEANGDCAAVLALGPLPAHVLAAWQADGRTTAAQSRDHALQHWVASDWLPEPLAEMARAALGPCTLLQHMPLPTGGYDVRRSYALRMLSCHILGRIESDPPRCEAGPSQSAQRCIVCLEDFDATRAAHRIERCGHAANTCGSCLLTHARHARQAPKCPDLACCAPLGPDDLLRAGAKADDADRLAQQICQAFFARYRFVWRPCPTGSTDTRPCPGGTLYALHPPEASPHCRVCDKASPVAPPNVDWSRDTELFWRLIDGLAARTSYVEHRTRQCPSCFFPVDLDSGCGHAQCLHCHTHFNFSSGQVGRYDSRGALGAQTYVPTGGLLLAAKVFDGLEPGQHGVHNLHAIALGNARRPGYPPRPRLAIEAG